MKRAAQNRFRRSAVAAQKFQEIRLKQGPEIVKALNEVEAFLVHTGKFLVCLNALRHQLQPHVVGHTNYGLHHLSGLR